MSLWFISYHLTNTTITTVMLITSNPALLSIGIGVWGWFILEKVAMDEDAEKWVVHSDDG